MANWQNTSSCVVTSAFCNPPKVYPEDVRGWPEDPKEQIRLWHSMGKESVRQEKAQRERNRARRLFRGVFGKPKKKVKGYSPVWNVQGAAP